MFLQGLSVIGYALTLLLLLQHGIFSDGGNGGGDVFAYWTAGRNLTSGAAVYGTAAGGYAAYLYPPPMAQLFSIVASAPLWVVVWGWRVVEVGALAAAVGGIRNAGIACLVWPPVIAELDAGNVHLLIAAAVAMAIRGDGRAVVPIALTKYASIAALPRSWMVDRRGTLIGAGFAVATIGASWVLAPSLWRDWLSFAVHIPDRTAGWYNLGALVPLPIRLTVASALALAAVRWPRLIAPAATLALPILWLHGLSALVAVATPSRTQA